jgi:hypothetical protein
MEDGTILKTLRAQAWERAKGELHAVEVTFFSHIQSDNKHESYMAATDSFIEHVENHGLVE